MFMQSDLVRYVGNKPLLKKSNVKKGEVLAQMGNEPGVYVVEFGDDAYVVREDELTRYVATAQDLEQAKVIEIQKKHYRRSSEE